MMKYFYVLLLIGLPAAMVNGQSTGTACGFGAAIPANPGHYVRQWHCAQINAAKVRQLMLYQCDWIGQSAELSPFAIRQIHERMMRSSSTPMLAIQTSGIPSLDEQRRIKVMEQLGHYGIPVLPGTIQVTPVIDFAYGERAPIIAARALNTSNRQPNFGATSTNRPQLGQPSLGRFPQ